MSATNADNYIGSDGLPLVILRCGHPFDKTCWEKWISEQSSKNIHQCPICRQDLASSPPNKPLSLVLPSSTTTTSTVMNHTQSNPQHNLPNSSGLVHRRCRLGNYDYGGRNEFNMYQRHLFDTDRNFRLNMLSRRYPRYIRQSQVDRWCSSDYQGAMVKDRDFVRMEPGTESHWGGGSSGGGSGGRW